jgi:hypothetical protein
MEYLFDMINMSSNDRKSPSPTRKLRQITKLPFEYYNFLVDGQNFKIKSKHLLDHPASFLTLQAACESKENFVNISNLPVNMMKGLVHYYKNNEWKFEANNKFDFSFGNIEITSFNQFKEAMNLKN